MSRYMLSAAIVGAIALAGLGADFKSGLEPGQTVSVFNPLNVNGPDAGEKRCQIWANGNNPVAAVFAREITPGLTSLVKKLDEAARKNSDCRMGSFVILLSDDDKMEDKLKELCKKQDIKKLVLAIDNPQGPPSWKIAKDAEVTVMFYSKRTVKKNYAFEKGKLTDKDIEKIVSDLKTILPEKSDK